MTATAESQVRCDRNAWLKLYHGETRIDFIGRWKIWFAISGVVIVAGLVSLSLNGLNLGIDFKGGNVWQVAGRPARRSPTSARPWRTSVCAMSGSRS